MELRQYCQAVININDHIADKQAERDKLILAVRQMHNITVEEFDEAYKKIAGHCPSLSDTVNATLRDAYRVINKTAFDDNSLCVECEALRDWDHSEACKVGKVIDRLKETAGKIIAETSN